MGGIDIAAFASQLLIYMVVLLLAISCHEAGHAWMSYKYGDDTAYLLGRVTLNPIAHTDPIGTLLIPMLGFIFAVSGSTIPLIGWGKPTPVNPLKWRKKNEANVMVSIAGIGANLILAIGGFVIFKSLLEFGVLNSRNMGEGVIKPIVLFLVYLIMMNVSLAVFNLLPFPPLDGSKVLETFLPASFEPVINLLEQFGYLILLALLYMGVIGAIMYPFLLFVDYLLYKPWFIQSYL